MQYENFYGGKGDAVIELTSTDFDLKKKQVKHDEFKNKMGLIMIYAPWCGHCRNMIDVWKDLAGQFRYRFVIGAVNSENINAKNVDVIKGFKVKYYPTVKFVNEKGKVTKFDGLLTKDDLLYFISSKGF